MKVELISKTIGLNSYSGLNDEEHVSAIARHSTIKPDGGKLIKYLIKNKHWSPLQFLSFGFKIETSRAISAQIFRHRSLNAQEWSQRYSKTTEFETAEMRLEHDTKRQSSSEWIGAIIENEGIFVPEIHSCKTKHQMKAISQASEALQNMAEAYNELIESGVAKECARMILPMGTKTTIHISGTLRDLFSFMNVRLDQHAQKEIQDLAKAIGVELKKHLPNVFESLPDWEKGLFL